MDFPLLISLDEALHPHVFASAKTDGSDLLVTKADGTTVLPRELVDYDAAGEKAEIWVRADALSKTENGFYLYYGNPDTSLAANPGGAWRPDYRAVYHFADDPGGGVLTDSSPQGVHAVLDPLRNWTSSDVADGAVGQAWVFNGSTQHVASFVSVPDSSYVLSAWLEMTSRSTDFFIQAQPGFWHCSAQASDQSNQADYVRADGVVRWPPRPIPINDGYHYFAWVFDHLNQNVSFYFDGVEQPVLSTVPPDLDILYRGEPINPDGNQIVGILGPRLYNQFDLMSGGGDEYRVYQGTLSSDWIRTEYRNQRDPLQFFVFGPEEVPVPVDTSTFGTFKMRFRRGGQ